jgi:hypothetical protein
MRMRSHFTCTWRSNACIRRRWRHPKYRERFADVTDEKRQLLLAMLSALTTTLARCSRRCHEHKLDDNTLVIFLSDNGGPTNGNGSRNDPLRGFKGQVYEGGVRIPFMARWPGHFGKGTVYEKPRHLARRVPDGDRSDAARALLPNTNSTARTSLPFLLSQRRTSGGVPHEDPVLAIWTAVGGARGGPETV